ncbi:unnamed protein product [Zymoseptoria tritici ST99CH_3D1]|nr:unnamed protein product [Zymoseptoria tritici ST99CH_3D1]
MRTLGKTEEVAELLRRLPYTRSPSGEEGKGMQDPQYKHAVANGRATAGGAPGGGFTLTDWTKIARNVVSEHGPCPESTMNLYRQPTEGVYEHVPSHVVGLVSAAHFEMFLDTQLGVIYFPGWIYVPGPTAVAQDTYGPFKPAADDPHDYASTEEANDWRTGGMGLKCAWAIPEFFEMMKYHFRNLTYLPLTRVWVAEAFGEDEENARGMPAAFPIVRQIFQKHGWLDLARYQKEKCMDELDSRWEELFDH